MPQPAKTISRSEIRAGLAPLDRLVGYNLKRAYMIFQDDLRKALGGKQAGAARLRGPEVDRRDPERDPKRDIAASNAQASWPLSMTWNNAALFCVWPSRVTGAC